MRKKNFDVVLKHHKYLKKIASLQSLLFFAVSKLTELYVIAGPQKTE
jgi:hypothetical protein